MASPVAEEEESKIVSPINNQNDTETPSQAVISKDSVLDVARTIASQSLQNYDSNVWGVLTAISYNARKRRQGINLLLTCDEHSFGRLPAHASFQIHSISVSKNHCSIYRKQLPSGDLCVFMKDTSANGTFLNWEKLIPNGPEIRVQHGDIISLVGLPDYENSFAFVYREVVGNNPDLARKRKAEDLTCENKRSKSIDMGPTSLDDTKSDKESNLEKLDFKLKRLEKDLESEKAAREEAELQLHGAMKRIMLCKTQLRTFCSAIEEILAMCAKQLEEVKTMERILEEENFDSTSRDMDHNHHNPINKKPRATTQDDERNELVNCAAKGSSSTSEQRSKRNEVVDTSSEKDADATQNQKHDL